MKTLGLLGIMSIVLAAIGCSSGNGYNNNVAGVPQSCANIPSQYCMPYGGGGISPYGYGGGYGGGIYGGGFGGGGCNSGWTPMAYGSNFNCINSGAFSYGSPYMSGGFGQMGSCFVGQICPDRTICQPFGFSSNGIGYCI